MKGRFEQLYTLDDALEIDKINKLTTNIYIPVLDDPISNGEINDALKECKKGGYDYTLPILRILTTHILPLLLLLINAMFYISYPLKLACSLLITIPKAGNLNLPKNFRGIQMLPAIGVLYDRIISKRLESWIYIHDEQTGFQKGKSTLTQIFVLRVLIELARKTKSSMFIGCFDIEKAFNKVSRFILFEKLIKLGIGFSMLCTLKTIYTSTTCILSKSNKLSKQFYTKCGIRQGAPSSSLLFIVFINDLIDYVKNRCIPEILIDTIHILLHADDTVIISTQENLFIQKCNIMLQYFSENKLKLNLGKSGYMVITNDSKIRKNKLEINNGYLKYKNVMKYLGIQINDSGNIKKDADLFVNDKRGEICTKFTTFCAYNYLAPLSIKLKVLNACLLSSILYGCECWGNIIPKGLEVAYRMAIKTALGVRTSTNNIIVSVESGLYPLECIIRKRQLAFWLKIENCDNLLINKILTKANEYDSEYVTYYKQLKEKYGTPNDLEYVTYYKQLKEKYGTPNDLEYVTYYKQLKEKYGTPNDLEYVTYYKQLKEKYGTPNDLEYVTYYKQLKEKYGTPNDLEYVTYYKQLKEKYGTPNQCERSIQLEYVRKWKESIITSSNEDANSKLGTYYDVNPDCKSEHNATYINMLELERITLSRYRTGSHNLKIETGRHSYPKIAREQRICKCNEAVQTLHHILFDCNLLRDLRECRTYNTTEEFFKWDGAATYLLRATKVLKIEI